MCVFPLFSFTPAVLGIFYGKTLRQPPRFTPPSSSPTFSYHISLLRLSILVFFVPGFLGALGIAGGFLAVDDHSVSFLIRFLLRISRIPEHGLLSSFAHGQPLPPQAWQSWVFADVFPLATNVSLFRKVFWRWEHNTFTIRHLGDWCSPPLLPSLGTLFSCFRDGELPPTPQMSGKSFLPPPFHFRVPFFFFEATPPPDVRAVWASLGFLLPEALCKITHMLSKFPY